MPRPARPVDRRVDAFKLTSLAGAYWRGDENRQMLTRVYGTAFVDKKELKAHLGASSRRRRAITAASARSSTSSGCGRRHPGCRSGSRTGRCCIELVAGEMREQLRKRGYEEIRTPEVLDEELWHRSGHWDNYVENMYFTEADGRRSL